MPADPNDNWNSIREKIIGLGEQSIKKSYYPELQQRLLELERFRALLDVTNEAIFLSEVPSGRFTDVNNSACEQLGYSPQEMNEMSVEDIIAPEKMDEMRDIVSNLIDGKHLKNRQTIETVLRKSDNSQINVEINIGLVSFGDDYYLVIVARDITERKEAEQTLKESEERFKTVADYTYDWEYWIDPDGNYIYVSPSCERVTGYTPIEFLKYPDLLLEITHPDDREMIKDHSHQELGKEGPISFEYRIINYEGNERWVAHVCVPVYNDNGMFLGRRASNRDVTERKKAEKELKLANLYNRSLIEVSLDPLVTIGPDGKITDVNIATEAVTGFSRDKLVGTDFSDYFVEPNKAREGYEQVFKEGFVRDYPLEILNKDGGMTPVLYNASVYRDESGDVVGVFAAARDISMLKQAEERIQMLANVVESSDDAIITKSLEGHITSWNKGAQSIYGYSAEEIVGKDISILAPLPQKAEIKQLIEKIKRGEHVIHYDTMRVRKDGKEINVSLTLSPVFDSSGALVGISTIARDITQRKQTEEELIKYREHLEELVQERTSALENKTRELEDVNVHLQELDRLKSMFIASMSHELRTPLNSIIGFTGIILMGMAGDISEEQKKQLTIVKNSADHLLSLVNDVIDVSKVEAGIAELDVGEFNLSEIIWDLHDSFKVAAQDKNLELSVNTPDSLMISSDERRVKQIIMNLLSNAIKFTDEGKVEVEVAKINGIAEITVKDTGMGINGEDMDKLFRAFSQIYVEGRPKQEGTGLGLYLSKKIANILGGEIGAESDFGKGSKFTFTVPRKYKV